MYKIYNNISCITLPPAYELEPGPPVIPATRSPLEDPEELDGPEEPDGPEELPEEFEQESPVV